MSAVALQGYTSSKLLNRLPTSELQRLLPHFETIPLTRNEVLFEAGDKIQNVYFPLSGLVSLLNSSNLSTTPPRH